MGRRLASNLSTLILAAVVVAPLWAQNPREPRAHVQLKTRWTDLVSKTDPLPDYPRPAMARKAWLNLNGQWDYAVTDSGAAQPTAYEGKILVPFPYESLLSGVQKAITKKSELWYH